MPLFGFFDYNKSGKGVAKDAPVKRPFFKFWELFARKFWKFFYINLVYVLFCLPIVTFGPATVAMTQVMRKFTLEKPIFVFDEFWRAFKSNFKQSVGLGIVNVIFIISFAYAYFYYDFLTINDPSFFNLALMSMTIAAGAFVLMMHFYIYPQIASLTLNLNQIIKNSLLLVVLGIKGSLVTLIVTILVLLPFILFPFISVFLLPVIPFAWLNFLMVFCAYPTIQKYIITPFYEERGEKNPEIPDYSESDDSEEVLFEDFGGREAVIKSKPKPKGKVIR
ncbi:MAG: DUF624 domain-containing protein [Oscillospiraceae bacterium]|nr:DUF624 domain-containing protein [Oscillospiraceae bacterium]